MIQYLIMKRLSLSLIALTAIVGAHNAYSSECVGDDCELAIVSETAEPGIVLWSAEEVIESETTCEYDYTCPFDTEIECAIWRKKPVYNESVYPRAPHLNTVAMDGMIYAINMYSEISANDPIFAPLVERYKMLMRASKSCCTSGIVYQMQSKKINEDKIYDFLKDDANIFAVTKRCLVMNNDDIVGRYSNGVDDKMVSLVRNTCLCKNRDWFVSLLQPFNDLYERAPQFESMPFNYTYTDGLQRNITISINHDVQNTINMLANCPD